MKHSCFSSTYHIENTLNRCPYAKQVIFFAPADAFGSIASGIYPEPGTDSVSLLSGFTAKLLVLNGITGTDSTFSSFASVLLSLSLSTTKYGEELVKKMADRARLVNTCWAYNSAVWNGTNGETGGNAIKILWYH